MSEKEKEKWFRGTMGMQVFGGGIWEYILAKYFSQDVMNITRCGL